MDLLCLKAKTTSEQATALLRQGLRETLYGRLRLVMNFYLPFRLFRMTIENGNREKELLMAIDAVTGGLDLYLFDEVPRAQEFTRIQTSRYAPSLLGEAQALKLLGERLKREAYLKGFFKLGELEVRGEFVSGFSWPYWVGIYERDERARLEVLDAVRGRLEGAKLREVVTDWFGKQ
ncbi:MAG TPA: hypothetical protein PLD20_11435 [Blastocatellia bacterium]|nr:hypothetical protein [Blastocatellia bacterium]HMY71502.1 hypothetical protein [Blastocatellia bacterium]HMZ18535.1 hypothetical protein [Blastocatellia bacterium]HNG33827.1 hypothetical protein [Blastocatellia bacterium]